MNIGLFSSYGLKCGIAEYNMFLFHALKKLGHSVTIFGNRIDTIRPEQKGVIIKEANQDPSYVIRCFSAGAWCYTGDFDFSLMFEELERRKIELIIVQYQNGIFNDKNLRRIFEYCKHKGIQVIVTFHDSCIGPLFPYELVKHTVSHYKVAGTHHLPFGIPAPILEEKEQLKKQFGYKGTIISTLGLGRTNYHLISNTAAKLGYQFLVIDSTHSCQINGEHLIKIHKWLSQDQLLTQLAASDAIVLWYPEIEAKVHSSAVTLALSTLRPVIVNDVGWFKEIPDNVVLKVKSETELIELLHSIDQLPINQKQVDYVNENQWKNIAKKYLQLLEC
ncbi:glycosyltransferase family protein [Priestia abyssalis]|uniref:hypothetical protein n=1 Tax=Priestia abyssalis TaxID=1221450 RepID=UPI000995C619|nr:hypothetical protein [Priestia abyssalis]